MVKDYECTELRFHVILLIAIGAWFYTQKNSQKNTVSELDFARNVAKRLDEHRELVQSIEKLANDPLYINALNSAESLVQLFLVVGELVINKFIFDNKLDGERFDDVKDS